MPTAPRVGFTADNGKFVCAADFGTASRLLIAKVGAIGVWETFELFHLGRGTVALKAAVNGLFVRAVNTLPLQAMSNTVGGQETFQLVDRGGGHVALRAANGKYVSADIWRADKQFLCAIADQIGRQEEFQLFDLSNVALRAANGKYVCAEVLAGKVLIAKSDAVGMWEAFQLSRFAGNVALQVDGQYVSAAELGAKALIATSNAMGVAETFQLVGLGGGKVALKAVNGRFVCAANGGSRELIATSDAIGVWETFELLPSFLGVVSGDGQRVTRTGTDEPGGVAIFRRLTVVVNDAAGVALRDVPVIWRLTGGTSVMRKQLDAAGSWFATTTTAADGRATLSGFPDSSVHCANADGEFQVVASHIGGGEAVFKLVVEAVAEPNVSVVSGDRQLLPLPPGGAAQFEPLKVRVRDSADRPVSNADVIWTGSGPPPMVTSLNRGGGPTEITKTGADGIATLASMSGRSVVCRGGGGTVSVVATTPGSKSAATFHMSVDPSYPYTDGRTGEKLYHDPIRFTLNPGLQRSRTRGTPVDLLAQQPLRIASVNGILTAELTIAMADVVVNGQTVHLRTYNGTFPGPTLVARPGDVLRVSEINNLPPEPPMPVHNMNHPHGFNDVNFHTHGLNVNPLDSEDNVFLVVHPGETFKHEIHVPSDQPSDHSERLSGHPTGTFWYHPHKHGSASCQAGSGMAGLLLITDPGRDIRAVEGVSQAREVTLMFQEIYINDNPDGTGAVPDVPIKDAGYFYGRQTRCEQTVNGFSCKEVDSDGREITPTLTMRPGEVQHWRMVHAGVFNNWIFGIEGHQSHILACDGVTLPAVQSVDEFLFSPGQRRDILVKASNSAGTYAVKRKAYKQGEQVNRWPDITLFNLKVEEGQTMDMRLPTVLNPPRGRLPYIGESVPVFKRNIKFDFLDDPAHGMQLYTINERVFKPGRVDFTMFLGNAEEWTISNNISSDHPFHIHVNWFELVSTNETMHIPPPWMDTANVPASGNIKVRMRPEQFQGQAVFHCHFSAHEDEGMMATIEIVDGAPKTQTIMPAGGTVVSQDYANGVQIRFLRDSVHTATAVTYQYCTTDHLVPNVGLAPSLPPGVLVDYNAFFKLSATQGGNPITEFNLPATIEVKYSSAQVDVNVPMNKRNVYYHDDTIGWTRNCVNMIARTDDLLTCSTTKLGLFAVAGDISNQTTPANSTT